MRGTPQEIFLIQSRKLGGKVEVTETWEKVTMSPQKKSLGRVRYEAISSIIEDEAAAASF